MPVAISAWLSRSFRFAKMLPTGGYTDAKGTPSAPLLEAIEHTDQSDRQDCQRPEERKGFSIRL